jgi:hypothetical protein
VCPCRLLASALSISDCAFMAASLSAIARRRDYRPH